MLDEYIYKQGVTHLNPLNNNCSSSTVLLLSYQYFNLTQAKLRRHTMYIIFFDILTKLGHAAENSTGHNKYQVSSC